MPGFNLPPGCTRLPGEEDEEPLYWRLGENVKKWLRKHHSEWRARGNREDYIASDCWKDADLDGISTGIINVVGNDHGLVVTWGWCATFCAGDDKCNEQAELIVQGCNIPGDWNCDDNGDGASWTVSGTDDFQVDMEDIVNEACPDGLASTAHAAKEVWGQFCKHRLHIEEEASLCHDMLNKIYTQTSGAS